MVSNDPIVELAQHDFRATFGAALELALADLEPTLAEDVTVVVYSLLTEHIVAVATGRPSVGGTELQLDAASASCSTPSEQDRVPNCAAADPDLHTAPTEQRKHHARQLAPIRRRTRYPDRKFPAPVDHGIAHENHAQSTVLSGTDAESLGGGGDRLWYQGGGRVGERPVENITVYPPTRGVQTQGDALEPVKIGILIDMDLNQLTADWIDPTILAIEDAMNEGVWARSPVQMVVADARGLPRENYKKLLDGYRWLVDAGLRGGARAHDLGQLPGHPGPGQRARACRASGGPGPGGSHRTTASPSPTATSRPRACICANWLYQQGVAQGRPVLGGRVVGHATTPTSSVTRPSASA